MSGTTAADRTAAAPATGTTYHHLTVARADEWQCSCGTLTVSPCSPAAAWRAWRDHAGRPGLPDGCCGCPNCADLGR